MEVLSSNHSRIEVVVKRCAAARVWEYERAVLLFCISNYMISYNFIGSLLIEIKGIVHYVYPMVIIAPTKLPE